MTSLAIVLGALGDTLLLLPALRELARAGPLEVWGPSLERLWPLRAPLGPAASVSAFPPEALALWSDAPAPPALRARLSRYSRTVAFTGADDALASSVLAIGGETIDPAAVIRSGARVGLEPDDALRERGRALAGHARYVACHPGSGSRRKRWPLSRFVELLADAPLPVVFASGPAEVEWPLEGPRPPRMLEDVRLPDLTALLAGASAYVGNDSGPSHLAAALAIPTLALFGPTDPAIWRPRGPGRVSIVQLDDLDTAPVAAVRASWLELLGVALDQG